jgi:hypothetical protein
MRIAPNPVLSGRLVDIPDGSAGVARTLAVMRALVRQFRVDPGIRQSATSIVFLTPEKHDISECRALFEYVRDHVRYTRDVYDVETLSTPDKTLAGLIGDCDDQTVLLASLFESVGYPTRFVIAGYSDPSVFEHVYLQVFASENWIDCDPTEQEPFGWSPPDPQCIAYERV